MRINITERPTFSQPVVGNVYSVNGGYGRKAGHAMVLFAITAKHVALLMIIDNAGDIIGVTSYGIHYFEERVPIAFVPGLDDLVFNMEAIP